MTFANNILLNIWIVHTYYIIGYIKKQDTGKHSYKYVQKFKNTKIFKIYKLIRHNLNLKLRIQVLW